MALIAITTHADRVEIVTDHLALGADYGRHTGTVSKLHLMPHLDAAMLVQGDHGFFGGVAVALTQAALIRNYDELLEAAPGLLAELWRHRWDTDPDATPSDTTVYLSGHSDHEERFRSYAFPSAGSFGPVDLADDLFVFPAPYSEYEVPDDLDAWRSLVDLIHAERSLDIHGTGRKVPTGGRIIHTELQVGIIHQQVIGLYPNHGPAFHRMMQGFNHPSSQLRRCDCGSGKTFTQCCDAAHDLEPCECGSGQTFGDCCRLPDDIDPADPCPCLSGRKLEGCCAPHLTT